MTGKDRTRAALPEETGRRAEEAGRRGEETGRRAEETGRRAETALPQEKHAVRLENREKLLIEGVRDVAGFDENMVVLSTALGDLNVRGEGLHIEKIDLEAGRLELHGKLVELSYDEPAAGGGWWSRLFG